MKVLFDHQIFSYQKYGGVSRYFCELLDKLPKENWDTTTLFTNNEYVEQKNLFRRYHFLNKYWFKGQGRIMNELNKPYSLYRLQRNDYDIFHQTHFETYCLKAIGNKPMVTTFHDVNFSTFNKNVQIEKNQKLSLKRADRIIAVSQNTKKDLIEIFDINPNKIDVIYHGINKELILNLPNQRIIENPYILYVGNRFEFKNFHRFVKAFSCIANKYPELRMVCTQIPFSEKELMFLKENKIDQKVIHFCADEQTLAMLYRDAEMFVFPSLYEGFGMPILEAIVNKCPVVLSNASCFPEIAGDAGLYFDPFSIEDMTDVILKVLEDSNIKTELINKGIKRLKLFSWEKTAIEHMDVYRSLT